jgi:RES domain-containing protein
LGPAPQPRTCATDNGSFTRYVELRIPETIGSERISPANLPDWNSADQVAARGFGDRWLLERRSSILIVPSVVTQGIETNVLLNPLHPDFGRIGGSGPHPVRWDSRFFSAKKR